MAQNKIIIDERYEVLEEIGRGGMSIVYKGKNVENNQTVAIKKMSGGMNREIVFRQTIAEAMLLRNLDCSGIPKIYDIIEKEANLYIVMEYIEGESLKEIVEEEGMLSEERVIHYAKILCRILFYLHSRKPPIIYRDMKPANIIVTKDGRVYLVDFGCAREYKENVLADTCCLGTVGYAAPEQFGGMGQTDIRTDIYGFGATLYHLLTGNNPTEPPHILYPVRQWNTNYSKGIEEIISKCIAVNSNDRYQSFVEVELAFEYMDGINDRSFQRRKWSHFMGDHWNHLMSKLMKKRHKDGVCKKKVLIKGLNCNRGNVSVRDIDYFSDVVFEGRKIENVSIKEID